MSLPAHLQRLIYIDSCRKIENIVQVSDFDLELIDKVLSPAGGPYGNCSSLELENGNRLIYIRSFGYRLQGKPEDPAPGAPGWNFVLTTVGGVCPRLLGIDSPHPELDPSRVEDLRLYRHRGRLRAIGSYVCERGGKGTPRKIGILILDLVLHAAAGSVEISPVYCSWKDTRVTLPRVTKNWMPIEGDESKVIYEISDNHLTVFDLETGVMTSTIFPVNGRLSGGPPTVRLQNGNLLLLCHDKPRSNYRFQLLEISPGWILVRRSPWFKFSKTPVEFCTHMEVRGDQVEFIYTVLDQRSYRCTLPIDDLFRPLGT